MWRAEFRGGRGADAPSHSKSLAQLPGSWLRARLRAELKQTLRGHLLDFKINQTVCGAGGDRVSICAAARSPAWSPLASPSQGLATCGRQLLREQGNRTRPLRAETSRYFYSHPLERGPGGAGAPRQGATPGCFWPASLGFPSGPWKQEGRRVACWSPQGDARAALRAPRPRGPAAVACWGRGQPRAHL